jgi:hypothetical protein
MKGNGRSALGWKGWYWRGLCIWLYESCMKALCALRVLWMRVYIKHIATPCCVMVVRVLVRTKDCPRDALEASLDEWTVWFAIAFFSSVKKGLLFLEACVSLLGKWKCEPDWRIKAFVVSSNQKNSSKMNFIFLMLDGRVYQSYPPTPFPPLDELRTGV